MLGGDALILTLQGPRFVMDLVDEGMTFVYTWDGVKVTVGEIEVMDSHRRVARAIVLDSGETVHTAPDTRVLLRSEEEARADKLTAGASLLPLYTKLDSVGYLIYQEPGEWHQRAETMRDSYSWRRVSRMVAEWKMRRRCCPGDVVSFKDEDRSNHHPDNLEIQQKKPRKTKQKVKFAEPIFKAHRFIRRHNHKVMESFSDISRDLFSICGPESANLAVNGIFISVDTE